MLSDLRYALRQLVKSPGFTTMAVLSLALGLGVNATMFSFVRSMVLQPLIRNRRERLVSLYTAGRGANRDFRFFSYPEFQAIRASRNVFSDVAAIGFSTCVVGRSGNLKHTLVGLVSENYFAILHVQPIEGRFFSTDEARAGAEDPVAVATYALWQRLGHPEHFIGSQIQINSRPYTVIGITPPGGDGLSSVGPDVWLPIGMARLIWGDSNTTVDFLNARTYRFSLIGCFQAGVSFENAHDRLATIDRRLNAPPIGIINDPRELVLAPPPRLSLHASKPQNEGFLVPFALIAMVLAATVLIVASLNLANLLLARGVSRKKEIAIRLALGASRWRIVRQLLSESVLLALAGGLIGMLLSYASQVYLHRLIATDFAAAQFDLDVHHTTDIGDIAAIIVLCFASAIMFGLGPALRISRVNLVDDLKRQPEQPSEGGRWNRFFSPRHRLMMMQIALSLMLLFSAGLFVRSSRKAINFDPGFEKTGELVVNIDYVDPNLTSVAIARREQATLDCAVDLPGIASAALASAVPFNFDNDFRRVFSAEADTAALNADDKTIHAAPSAAFTAVSLGYFKTLEIPLIKGRDFTEAESTIAGGHKVAIIDERLAQALFGGKNPIGQHITTNAADANSNRPDRGIEIVGIVRSPHETAFEAAAPYRIYCPLGQRPSSNIYLQIRVSDPSTMPEVLNRLRRELASLDSDNPVLLAQPLADFIDKNVDLLMVHIAGMVFGVSGAIALLLAVIGVYGVKAHAVVRRTREIGIRIALGAEPADIFALIIKQGILQTLVGVSVGIVLAVIMGRLLAKMLYHVNPLDPVALAVAAIILMCTVIFACYMPARRATKVDPAVTLRVE